MPKLNLPWGEILTIDTDVEQFSMDLANLVAEYYVDQPFAEPKLVVVRSTDFFLAKDDETIIVQSCSVTISPAFPDEFDSEEQEQVWKDFMLFDEAAPPGTRREHHGGQ